MGQNEKTLNIPKPKTLFCAAHTALSEWAKVAILCLSFVRFFWGGFQLKHIYNIQPFIFTLHAFIRLHKHWVCVYIC